MLSYHTHQKKATPETKPVVSGNPASNNEIFSLQIQHFLIQSFLFCGPVVQSVSTPACHAGGRRFESVPGRHKKARFSACFFVILSKPPAFSKRRQGVFSVGAASGWKLRLIYFNQEIVSNGGGCFAPFWGCFHSKREAFRKECLSFHFPAPPSACFFRLCRYRPYPKAGRTVRLRLFALGKPFLTGMPDRIPRGIWKANARLHVLTAFDRPWGIICRLPNRGTV